MLDSIMAAVLAPYIMFEAFKLLKYSMDGLINPRNPSVDKAIRKELAKELPGSIINVHSLRHCTGVKPRGLSCMQCSRRVNLETTHDDATLLERGHQYG